MLPQHQTSAHVRFWMKVPQSNWIVFTVVTSVIAGVSLYVCRPMYLKNEKATKAGHNLFDSEKPEVVQDAIDKASEAQRQARVKNG